MKKIVVAIVALAVLAVGAVIGVTFWARSAARAQVEAAFASLNRSGATASHGGIGFSLFSHTLTLSNVVIRSPDGAQSLQAASVIARGVTGVRDGRFSAAAVDVNGLAVKLTDSATRQSLAYEMPLLRLTGFSGPAGAVAPIPQDSPYPAVAFALSQFSAMSATRVDAPDLLVHAFFAPITERPRALEASYANLLAEGVDGGRIATLSFERMAFENTASGPGPSERMSGRLDNFNAAEIDTGPLLALVSPAAARSPGYRTVYGRMVATGYRLTQEDGSTATVDTIRAEGVGLDPTLLSLAGMEEFNTLSMQAKALPPKQEARLFELAAAMMKGVTFVSMSMEGANVADTTGKMRLAGVELKNFRDGTLERFTFQGLAGTTQAQQPLTLDTLTLKGFSLLPIFSVSAHALREQGESSMETGLALFRGLKGVEVSGLHVGLPDDQGPVTLKHLDLSWDDFVGMVPAHVTFKVKRLGFPLSDENGAPLSYLAFAGLDRAMLDLDFGLTYDRAAETLRLDPLRVVLDHAATLSMDASITNLPASAFETPASLLAALPSVTAGTLGVRVIDQGLVEQAMATHAREEDVTPQAYRQQVIEALMAAAQEVADDFPPALTLARALADFLKAPGTLSVTVTPNASVTLMELMVNSPILTAQAFTFTATATPSR